MATGNVIGGPRNYAFMATGPTTTATVAGNSITVTLSNYISTLMPPSECMFYATGAAAAVNAVSVQFGGNATVTASITTSMPIPTALAIQVGASFPMELLRTGQRPQGFVALTSAGTATVYITPGEGAR
jgi:hypothetical protein